MGIRTDLISEWEWEQLRQHLGLADQQADIVRLLFWGRSDVEIAQTLGIGLRTARTQIDHVYQTFDLSNRLQLVLHVLASLRDCGAGDDEALS